MKFLLLLFPFLHLILCQDIRQSCSEDIECQEFLKGSVCVGNGICACKPGFAEVDDLRECLPYTRQSCSEDIECQEFLKGSVCVGNGTCACKPGFAEVDDLRECLPFATFDNNVCRVAEQCGQMTDLSMSKATSWKDRVPNCDPDSHTCVCHRKRWYINRKEECVRGLNAWCVPFTQGCAVSHSSCAWSMTCKCDYGYVESNNACIVHECDDSSECSEHASCVNFTCVCDEGYVESTDWRRNKVCLSYAKPDRYECSEDVQCSEIEDGASSATCATLKGVCVCADSSMFIKEDGENDSLSCVRDFGSQCSKDEECQEALVDAVCLDGECGCSVDNARVEELHSCLPYATYDNNICEANGQCGRIIDVSAGVVEKKVAKCDQERQVCVCHENYWYIDQQNKCMRGLNASCTPLVSHCAVLHSFCSRLLKCECDSGYVEADNTCKEKPECEVSSDCFENSECVDFKCKCKDGYVEDTDWKNKKVCLRYAQPDSFRCEKDVQCSLIDDASSVDGSPALCSKLKGECVCAESSWFIQEGDDAKLSCARDMNETESLGEECSNNKECLTEHSQCLPDQHKVKRCQCTYEYVQSQRQCILRANEANGYVCEVSEQCNHIVDLSNTEEAIATCDVKERVCKCLSKAWFIYKADKLQPICSPKLNDDCAPDDKCYIMFSHCDTETETCQCNKEYTEYEDKACVQNAANAQHSGLMVSFVFSLVLLKVQRSS